MTEPEEALEATDQELKAYDDVANAVDEKNEQSIDEEKEGNGEEGEEKLSKREMKRRANMPKFLEYRKKKRVEERERKKLKKAAMKASGQGEILQKPKPKKMAESDCKMRLVVDMSFDDLMGEKDRRRCIAQLTFCYSVNRKADQPTQYHIVGFGGPSRAIYDANDTYAHWDVHLHREPLHEVIPKEDVVYLSAESENVLTELDDSKAYVIGGLVDHNSHKGVCFKKAEEMGWAHARLPIDEFVKMQSRRVLTVNHVFEIMVLYRETRDWEKAFFTVIPLRKGASKKEELYAATEAEGNGEVKEEDEEKEEAEDQSAVKEEPNTDVVEDCLTNVKDEL